MTDDKDATEPLPDYLKFARHVNQYVTEYIKIADAKVAGFITLTGAVTGLFFNNFKPTIVGLATDPLAFFTKLSTLGLIFGLAGTFICALFALSPRTQLADHSLTSFPDIAAVPASDYINQVFSKNTRGLSEQYLKHNHVLSKIAMAKHKWLKRAQWCCLAWFSSFLILLLIMFFS